jgi:hypothetical protein
LSGGMRSKSLGSGSVCWGLVIKTLPHTRRTNQTMTRMTAIVPTTPIPNIVPPVGNVGHLEHLINDGRASFRLQSGQT